MKKLLVSLMLIASTLVAIPAQAVTAYRLGVVEQVIVHGDPTTTCAYSGRGSWPSNNPSLPGQLCSTNGAYFEITVNVDGLRIVMMVSRPHSVGDRVKVRMDFNIE